MPKWGLSSRMRRAEPYGLTEDLLAPGKIITDPVQGDIRLTELERRIVDSPTFQRLRRVRQLGNTHLVYPGATHTRFSHSLGAVQAAQMLLDIVLEQRDEPDAREDLFAEWEREPETYLRRVAEASVLTRLGALLHDLCHVPFGHSVEDELQLLVPHDENRERFDLLWAGLDPTARTAIEEGISLTNRSLKDDLLPLILSKLYKPPESRQEGEDPGVAPMTYPFAQDIVGNTISADLIDYLTRDHQFTGLPAALGHRFLDSFYVSPSTDPFKPERVVLRIVKDRRERKDSITELLKFLRYRYELSERVLAHHAKLAADAMVGKLFQMYTDALEVEALDARAAEDEGLAKDLQGISRADLDAMRRRSARRLKAAGQKEVKAEARERLEDALIEHGDDGLLEALRAEGAEKGRHDSRWGGVRDLASVLLDRRLFKPVARLSDQSHAKRLWQEYGKSPDERRQVEQAAAHFADISPAWLVVLWVPPERMRLKPALVLVDDGELIDTLLLRERSPRGQRRGEDIYDRHRDLWALDVFVDSKVRNDQRRRDALLAALAAQLNISKWEDPQAPVEPAEVAQRLAGNQLHLTRDEEEQLKKLVPSFYDGSVTLRDGRTANEMADEYKLAWDTHKQAEDASASDSEKAGGHQETPLPPGDTDILGKTLDQAAPAPDDDGQQELT